jgi:hypothetical protein
MDWSGWARKEWRDVTELGICRRGNRLDRFPTCPGINHLIEYPGSSFKFLFGKHNAGVGDMNIFGGAI